jgi:hypothetical protein
LVVQGIAVVLGKGVRGIEIVPLSYLRNLRPELIHQIVPSSEHQHQQAHLQHYVTQQQQQVPIRLISILAQKSFGTICKIYFYLSSLIKQTMHLKISLDSSIVTFYSYKYWHQEANYALKQHFILLKFC